MLVSFPASSPGPQPTNSSGPPLTPQAMCHGNLRSLLVGFLVWHVLPHPLRLAGCSFLETSPDCQASLPSLKS